MDSLYKNSYLKLRNSYINSRVINRSVTYAQQLGLPNDIYDFEPPFFRLSSQQPEIPIENCDVTRRPQAFGRLALPKLRRELHHADHEVVLAAITSICDLVHDPERGYEALNLKITDRMTDLLLNPDPALRERTIIALTILSGLQEGRMAILRNHHLVENLAMLLDDYETIVRLKASHCFEMIARTWMAADHLVNYGFIEVFLDEIVEEFPDIVIVQLETLKHLLYATRAQNIAINNDAYTIFVNFFTHDNPELVSKALDCLMLLMSSKKGKKLAMENNLLKELNKLIHYGNPTIFTSAVSCIMFCTIKTKAKHLAAEIKSLPRRLLKLASSPLHDTLQMYCLKALTNICEHPRVRKEMKEKHLEEIKKLQVGSNEVYRQTLIQVINWLPTSNY